MPHTEDALCLPAPAKLNLFLHVLGRRDDGYHRLQTLFTFLDHHDRIHLRRRDDGRIVRAQDLAGVPVEADLTIRAARLLAEVSGCRSGVTLAVDKHLPMGGGLGGGSSDAATVLIGLNALWRLGLRRSELAALGLRLGADVPVFVHGDSAVAEGVGERLHPVAVPAAVYLVVVPPVNVPTAAVFAAPELTRDTPSLKLADFSTVAQDWGRSARNDLEAVVRGRYPQVDAVLAWFAGRHAARMTGSGCCIFAAFAQADQAAAAQAELPPGWRSFVAAGLQQHPLKDWPYG